jgi:hypothetical protein
VRIRPIVWPDLPAAALGLSHGIPLDEASPVGPIDCLDRCRRVVVPSHRRYPDVLLAKNFVDRSGVRVSRCRQKNAPRSAGQCCGAGFHCQRRCCHCPRPLSLRWGLPQRVAAQESCMPRVLSRPHRCFGSQQTAWRPLSQQAKVKISRATRTGAASQASHPWTLSGEVPCEASSYIVAAILRLSGPSMPVRPIRICQE